MAGLKEFVTRMNVVGNNVEGNANKMVKRCGLAVDQVVVVETPVDTGKARSNWQVTLDAPTSAEVEAYSPGDRLGKDETANRAAAELQAKETIAQRKPEQTIYIQNNVDYIGDLNRGTSPQAEAGFVQVAVQAGVDIVKNTRIL